MVNKIPELKLSLTTRKPKKGGKGIKRKLVTVPETTDSESDHNFERPAKSKSKLASPSTDGDAYVLQRIIRRRRRRSDYIS